MAINRVDYGNTTLIDLTDTTAVASDVAQGKYFYGRDGVRTAGTSTGSGGIATEDVPNATGTTCAITGDELPTIEALSVTQNGTYTATGGGGYSPVTVNVSGGTPSMTQHTIAFTFTDSTSTTITAYWDDSFITTAITATEPETYGGKTVATASLDGTTWYTRPTETWETIFDDNIDYYHDDSALGPYCWVTQLGDVVIPVGSVWRVTFDGTLYSNLIAKEVAITEYTIENTIGNPKWGTGTDDGTDVPFMFYQSQYGAWSGNANVADESRHAVKIERLVTS